MKISKLEWVLRIGVFGTFLGHGLAAITVNEYWVPYLTILGFTNDQAILIMPVIGSLDVVIAFWVLLKPNRYIVLWAIIWAFSTALIRPISGTTMLAFIERAANWAVPLALYLHKFNKSQS